MKQLDVWLEQQALRKTDCLLNIQAKEKDIERYKQQIELIKQSIALDKVQMSNINNDIDRIKKEWTDGK